MSLSASDGAKFVPVESSTDDADDHEHTMLRLALRGLPDDQRAVIALAVVHRLPVLDIARRLNAPEADVRSAMREGLWSLRSVLDVVDQSAASAEA